MYVFSDAVVWYSLKREPVVILIEAVACNILATTLLLEPVYVFSDAVVCRILFLTLSFEDVYVFTEPLNWFNKVISLPPPAPNPNAVICADELIIAAAFNDAVYAINPASIPIEEPV